MIQKGEFLLFRWVYFKCFQLIRFDPIGRDDAIELIDRACKSFQLIRFDPIGREREIFNQYPIPQ